jgi:hypothetical protein
LRKPNEGNEWRNGAERVKEVERASGRIPCSGRSAAQDIEGYAGSFAVLCSCWSPILSGGDWSGDSCHKPIGRYCDGLGWQHMYSSCSAGMRVRVRVRRRERSGIWPHRLESQTFFHLFQDLMCHVVDACCLPSRHHARRLVYYLLWCLRLDIQTGLHLLGSSVWLYGGRCIG